MTEKREPIDQVRGWLRRQGYRLEYTAAAALMAAGYWPERGQTYREPSGKTREIDVVAWPLTASFPVRRFEAALVVV